MKEKLIGEGVRSKAYASDGYVTLVPKKEGQLICYKRLKKCMDYLERFINIVSIPSELKIIEPNDSYPLGALKYKMVEGKELDFDNLSLLEKENFTRDIANFLNQLHEIDNKPCFGSKDNNIKQELVKINKNIEILTKFLTENEILTINRLKNEYLKFLTESEFCITHSDLHYENIMMVNGNISGVIDFGECCYFAPEADFIGFLRYGDEFVEKILKNYVKKLKIENIKLVYIMREIQFFENVLSWSEKAIANEVDEIKLMLK